MVTRAVGGAGSGLNYIIYSTVYVCCMPLMHYDDHRPRVKCINYVFISIKSIEGLCSCDMIVLFLFDFDFDKFD